MATYKSYGGELAALTSDMRKKGHDEAVDHRPPSTALHPDPNETAVRVQADEWINGEQYLFDHEVSNASKAAADIRERIAELENRARQLGLDSALHSTVAADLAGQRRELVAATEARIRAEVNYRAFRQENGIKQEAHYPDSRVMHFAIVIFAAIVETAVNSIFFENAQGILGGLAIATCVSAINMGSAMALGAGFRFKNLAAIEKRLFGWLCLPLFLVISIYCNALFSTFRAEYQVLVDPSDTIQLRSAFAASLAEANRVFLLDMRFADLMSFILFGIGLLLSGLAFWKGYTADDRFPGYGRRDRAVKSAKEVEQSLQEVLRQKVRDFLLKKRAEVASVMAEPGQLMQRLASQIANLTNAQSSLQVRCAAVQRDFKLVIDAYRQANAAVRGTDLPAYFANIDNLISGVRPEAAEPQKSDFAALQTAVDTLRDQIETPLQAKLAELQNDAAQAQNVTFKSFLVEVEDEAKSNINRQTPQ